VRYDACIIGAGAEGLAAAATLAGRGLRTLVIERAAAPGGRCTTQEFAPGFFASPFADDVPAIPPAIFRALDLARRGLLLAPSGNGDEDAVRTAAIAHGLAEAAAPAAPWWRRHAPGPWPGEDTGFNLSDGGSAMRALTGARSGLPRGGLGALASALHRAAEASGAEIRCGVEASTIRRRGGRAVAVGLADGSEIAARAVISTLDLKSTFLTLFAWNDLARPLAERVAGFRAAPGIARLLLALERLPAAPPGVSLRQPIACGGAAGVAHRAWLAATIPAHPPAILRVVSAVDPALAPRGAAVVTLTLGAIAHTPFDGPWDGNKRRALVTTALRQAEAALPGTIAAIKAAELILPPDIESRLGLTGGDLTGGDTIPGQMLGFRPFRACRGSRTPVKGLYLAGPSSALGPLATCASGVAAATAVLTDFGGAP